ncbi:MucB/RseB C-terminal domain-containing protein [Thioalkalivibrio sp. ALE20]|uniref:MucB/RseB C-terminal domain-containing protein n=1 Tax=Thioalkalivibrio sp. ALE20 TaxID=545275 RepID=UPI0003607C6F|nr:MucB/RseB C-terminal domain-containing protein [Thioalkalivibrio sp. ALE20]
MMRGGLPWVLAASVALLPLPVIASDPGPAEWLERMSASVHSESYRGTFVLQRKDRLDTVRVIHAIEDGGYRERLHTLSGQEREVVRSVDRLSAQSGTGAASGGQAAEAGSAPRWPVSSPVHLLAEHDGYSLKDQGRSRVAGHACRMLLARAGDLLRYSHRYCLHEDTGLPLLSELYSGSGQLLERLAFTDLELLDRVPDAALEPVSEGADRIEVRAERGHLRPDPDGRDWGFSELPSGFRLVVARERSSDDPEQPGRYFVVSDGLASVSVYVEPVEGERRFEGATRAGATHAVARIEGDYQITAVGDVPRETVERLAAAMHPPQSDRGRHE